MRSVIRAELGGDIEDYFDEWDWEPLGAASLAQCHKAKMKGTDDWVAVKVQHAPVKHTGKCRIWSNQKWTVKAKILCEPSSP